MDAKTQPLVSFIIPTYNIPIVMLRECVESITSLSLSVSEREIIVIDDGSDFSPVNELMEMAPDIIFIRQPNRGVSVARNMGMKIATGKFIQFVDGDDCLINAPYEHCLDIVRYQEPVDMVMFHFSQSKAEPADFTFKGPVTGQEYMATENLRASVCCYIFRRDRLDGLRFTPGIVHGEDEEFTAQLVLKMHNVYSTEAKAYYYRKREGSVTHTESKEAKKKHIEDMLKVILNLKAIADRCDPLKKVSMDRRVAQLLMDFLINVIRLTKSRSQLTKAIDLLKQHGLYPLPDENYTKEYTIFRYMIQKKAGQLILIAAL
jgi:glycosyltransferase involved in cell wall biosynthesis